MSGLPPADVTRAWSSYRLPRIPWYRRVIEVLSNYFPLLVMGLLAMGSWWLVKNTPRPEPDSPDKALRHVPDYTMHRFQVQRFSPTGSLRAQIEGEVLRHYPDTDTIEIDHARLRSVGKNGSVMLGSSQRAVVNSDGSEVQLLHDARVERGATPTQEAAIFTSDFLHFFVDTEQVRSYSPMTLRQGSTVLSGDRLEYDNVNRVAVVNGRVRATFVSKPKADASASTVSKQP